MQNPWGFFYFRNYYCPGKYSVGPGRNPFKKLRRRAVIM